MRDLAVVGDEALEDLATPALVVDLDQVEANLEHMARALGDHNIAVRPHAKSHKSIELAKLQRKTGATGITVATIGEAEVFANAGFDDIFLALPLWTTPALGHRIDHLTSFARLRIGVDSARGAEALLTHVQTPESVEVMLEIDSGQHRTGVQPEDAGGLGAYCRRIGLRVAGVFTHGGHSYAGREGVSNAAKDEVAALTVSAHSLQSHGITVEVFSAGSSPTALALDGIVTEARPGTYIFHDRQQVTLGSAMIEDVSAAVVTRVMSSAVPGQFVIDAGSKALTAEASALVEGFGIIPALGGAVVRRVSEHHGIVECAGPPPPEGTLLTVIPNHICTVVNLFDTYRTFRQGASTLGTMRVDARGHLT